MKIGWIFPHKQKCGIAIYARNYIATAALNGSALPIDPQWWFIDRKRFVESIAPCDILHLQYDTASFMRGDRDFYGAMMGTIKQPAVVSLHEVYREDPFAYPRSALKGKGPLRLLRQMLYDYRHPVQRAFNRHVAHAFFADRLMVHHDYHVAILAEKGIDPSKITVVPVPVKQTRSADAFSFPALPCVHLGAIGFINPTYDYELLFSVLEKCPRPWTFTWIGGTHSGRGDGLLDMINNRVRRNGWNDRFSITGWVADEELPARLAALDIVLSLFMTRSSSASLATAMGALKPVCTTRLPLTEEIAGYRSGGLHGSPLIVADADPSSIVECMESFLSNGGRQRELFTNLIKYIDEVSFEKLAEKLMERYRKVLEQ
jgi:glycosyltransferase involved in cell wall biosynthesis